MIHLSVAVGRFFEALFFAILGIAGWVTAIILVTAAAGALLFGVARGLIRHGERH